MRVVLQPFFSQQDKQSCRFLLESDSGVKLYKYIAEQMAARGDDVTFVLPSRNQCADSLKWPDAIKLRYAPHLEVCNLRRRVQWDTEWLERITCDCDLFLTTHEFLSIPLRVIRPKLRIVMECGIRPTTAWPETEALFPIAQRAATAVHCNSSTLASECANPRTFVWPFAFHEKAYSLRGGERSIDVLFNSRCSSTNYSHHKEFIEQMWSSGLRIRMTDPTNYLRSTGYAPGWTGNMPAGRGAYESLLAQSRIVVGLTDNGYGGYAFREAMAAGCCPVALDVPEYRELLGPDWPYYCTLDNIADVVRRALADGAPAYPVTGLLAQSSYQEAWKRAAQDLATL